MFQDCRHARSENSGVRKYKHSIGVVYLYEDGPGINMCKHSTGAHEDSPGVSMNEHCTGIQDNPGIHAYNDTHGVVHLYEETTVRVHVHEDIPGVRMYGNCLEVHGVDIYDDRHSTETEKHDKTFLQFKSQVSQIIRGVL